MALERRFETNGVPAWWVPAGLLLPYHPLAGRLLANWLVVKNQVSDHIFGFRNFWNLKMFEGFSSLIYVTKKRKHLLVLCIMIYSVSQDCKFENNLRKNQF